MVSGLCQQHSTNRCLPGYCGKKRTAGRSVFLRAVGGPYSHTEPDCYSKCEPDAKYDTHCNCNSDVNTNTNTNTKCDPISHSYTNCNTDSKAYADTKGSSNPETSPDSSAVRALIVINRHLTDEIQIQLSIRLS